MHLTKVRVKVYIFLLLQSNQTFVKYSLWHHLVFFTTTMLSMFSVIPVHCDLHYNMEYVTVTLIFNHTLMGALYK